MKLIRDNYYTPFNIVVSSVIISVLVFFTMYSFMPKEDFYYGLIKAIVIPIPIALPISLFTTKYHKKIYSQKKELEKLNELNNKLISIIAHDIRSPLSIVQGFVEMIHEDVETHSKEKVHDRLDSISGRIDHLLFFLNDLLRRSKNQIHVAPVTMEPFETEKTFKTILHTYAAIQKEKKITTSLEIELDELYSDKEIYSFIVRNLYHNALKFTPEGGTISLELKQCGTDIHTIITDSGIGIDKEQIAMIKNEKQWFSMPGTNKEKGTGLGIKTILQYLKICNGDFIIESEKDKGTKITVILPKKELLAA